MLTGCLNSLSLLSSWKKAVNQSFHEFFSLLVTLVHPADRTDVANGTVIVRDTVHYHPLTPDEVARITA